MKAETQFPQRLSHLLQGDGLVGLRAGGAICLALCSLAAPAQEYPIKPVRIYTAAPGGAVDVAARLLAQGLTTSLGQPVVVENRGGSAVIAAELVARSAPDGYALILYGSALWLTPYMRDKTPYDPIKDFAPISLTTRAPNVLVVHPSLPVRTVKDLIALAKARPGELNFASVGVGSSSQLAAELFKAMAGINIVHIPYKSNPSAMTDALSGQIQLWFTTTNSAVPQMQAHRLKALAVTSAQPSPLVPGLPTVAATGLPGYESTSINALFAPAKTPAVIINRLHQETVRILNTSEARERLFNAGAEPVGSSPQQLAQILKNDMTRLGKIIKDAGLRAD